MARFYRALALIAVLSHPTLASAEEFELGLTPLRVDLTSTTSIAWHGDNGDTSSRNDNYGELFERFNLSVAWAPWSAGLRIDTATFFSPPSPEIRDRYTPEKMWIGWGDRSAEVTLGDSYVSFGRGLALSIRKIDELGVDTTVRGVRASVHEGIVNATAIAGYSNIQNVDEASGLSLDDPYDLIGGLQFQLAVDRVTLGVHGSGVAFRHELGLAPGPDYEDRFYQFGPVIDAPRLTDFLGIYLEGIMQARYSEESPEGTGLGVYGAATVYAGPATLLFEGKAYGDLEPVKPRLSRSEFASVAYNNPPTLERVLQLLENPQKDIAGGRARLDWAFSQSLLAHISYALFKDSLGYVDPTDVDTRRPGYIHDPYVGGEVRWDNARSRARLTFGIRIVELSETHDIVRSDAHIEIDGVHALNDDWSLELHGLHIERSKYESRLLDIRYREGSWSFGVRLRQRFTLAAGYDYTTDPSQPKTHYVNGTGQWDITPSSSVRVLVGAVRGGLKCVSGVCRTTPAFEGVKVVAVLRF